MNRLKTMKNWINKVKSSKKGASLPLVLAFMSVAIIMGVTASSIAYNTYQNSYGKMCRGQANFTATSMSTLMLDKFKEDGDFSGNIIAELHGQLAVGQAIKDVKLDMNVDDLNWNMGEVFVRWKFGTTTNEIRIESHGIYNGFKEVVSLKIFKTSKSASALGKIMNNALFFSAPIVDVLSGTIYGNVYCDKPEPIKGLNSAYQYYEEIDSVNYLGNTKKIDIYGNELENPMDWVEVYIRSWAEDANGNENQAIVGNLIVADNALIGLYDKPFGEHDIIDPANPNGGDYNVMYDGWHGLGQSPSLTQMKIQGNIYVQGSARLENVYIDGDVFVDGDVYIPPANELHFIRRDVHITGNLHVGGKLYIADGVSVGGSIYVDGETQVQRSDKTANNQIRNYNSLSVVELHEDVTVGGSVYSGGDVKITDNVQIGGGIHAEGDVIVKDSQIGTSHGGRGGGISADGTVDVSSGVAAGLVYNWAKVGGSIIASKNINISGASITGDVKSTGQYINIVAISWGDYTQVKGDVIAYTGEVLVTRMGVNILSKANISGKIYSFESKKIPSADRYLSDANKNLKQSGGYWGSYFTYPKAEIVDVEDKLPPDTDIKALSATLYDWEKKGAEIYPWTAPPQETPTNKGIDYSGENTYDTLLTTTTTISTSTLFNGGIAMVDNSELSFDTTDGNIFIRVKNKFSLGENVKINLTGGSMVFMFFEFDDSSSEKTFVFGNGCKIGNITVTPGQTSFNDGIYFINSEDEVFLEFRKNLFFNGYIYMPKSTITPVGTSDGNKQVLNGCFAVKSITIPRVSGQGFFETFSSTIFQHRDTIYTQKNSPLILDPNGNIILDGGENSDIDFGDIIWEFGGYV